MWEMACPVLSCAGKRFPGRPGYPNLRVGDKVEACLRIERVYSPAPRLGIAPCRQYSNPAITRAAPSARRRWLPDGQEVFAIQQSSGKERLAEGEPIYVCWNPGEAALVQ